VAETFKNLGQQGPAGNTLTDLYTVPGATSAVVSSVIVCNRSLLDTTFRLSHAIAGAADTAAQYLYYDASVQAGATFIATVGLTLATTDVIRCLSSNGLVSFNLYGVEKT
jgi:homoserine dehydrogenase